MAQKNPGSKTMRVNLQRLFVGIWLLFCCCVASAAANSETTLKVQIAPKTTIPVWFHVPNLAMSTSPVVIVMHGNTRDADRYLDEWRDLSESYGFYLLVPEFSRKQFPSNRQYNLGNTLSKEGVNPTDQWTFSAIERIFDVFRVKFSLTTNDYKLYGHSAGAQFVHRFLYHVPDSRASLLVSANAGWYTLPDLYTPWPYGLKGSAVSSKNLEQALQKPLIVLLGDKDIDPNGKSLRKSIEAEMQGPHRFARGKYFFLRGQRAAAAYGVKFGWRQVEVPEVAHENRGMALAAVKLMFPNQ